MGIVFFIGMVVAIIFAYDARRMSDILRKDNTDLKKKIIELENKIATMKPNLVENKPLENDKIPIVDAANLQNETEKETTNNVSEEELARIRMEKARIEEEKIKEYAERVRLEKIKEAEEKQRREEAVKRKIKQDQDRKNTGILVVGAMLIILSAVVFLMSTWNFTHNALKTIIMALFVVVFLKISKIADEKHGLKKASRTFFYIAMAYIPICLISFCVFGLLGEYFSINGEGKYLYLSFSFILTSSIYYINYSKLKTKELFIGTILSQILSLILLLAIFKDVTYVALVTVLLIYNLILKASRFIKNELNISKFITNGIIYFSAIAMTLSFNEYETIKILPYILLILNIAYDRLKNDTELFLFNLITYEFGYFIIFKGFSNINSDINLIIAMVYNIAIFTIQYILFNEKRCKNASLFEIGSSIILVLLGLASQNSLNTVFILLIILLVYDIIIKFVNNSQKELNLLDTICRSIEFIAMFILTVTFFNKTNMKVIPMILLTVASLYNRQKSNTDLIITNLTAYELGYYLIFIMLNNIPQIIGYIIGTIYSIIIFTIQYAIFTKEDCTVPFFFEVGSIVILLLSGVLYGENVRTPYLMMTILLIYSLIVQFYNNRKDDNILRLLCRAIEFISIFLITVRFTQNVNIKVIPMILIVSNLMYNDKRYNLDLFLVNVMACEFGYYSIFIAMSMLSYDTKIIIGIIYSIVVFILHYILIDRKYFGIPAYFGMANIIALYIIGLGNASINAYVYLIVELAMMISCMYKNKEYWEQVMSALIPITMILLICNIIYVHLNFNYMYLISAIIVFVISEKIKTKSKYFNITIPIISNVFLTGTFLYVCNDKSITTTIKWFYSICVVLIYGYNYLKFQNEKKYSEGLLCYAAGIPLFCIEILNPELKAILYLIITIFITYKAILKKEMSLETLISVVYLLFTIINVDSVYLKYIIGLIWVFVNWYFEEKQNVKDVLKIIMYILIFLIYNTILTDIGISDKLNSFTLIGVTLLAISISRVSIIRSMKEINMIESIVFSALYLYAISNYLGELDGIIFVTGIVFITIACYYLRDGTIFVVSLIAILLNSILLTRKFWLMIPWWIYLLLIGCILIAFAIKNESDSNKLKKANPKNLVKKIIDKVENNK